MTRFASFGLTALLALAMASPVFAQRGFRPRDVAAPPATLTQPDRPGRSEPRFQVIPYALHAYDETGPDWPGSDEIYVIFSDAQTNSRVRTPIFSDFDTHETKRFAQAQACVTPIGRSLAGADGSAQAWECREGGVRAPLSFSFEIYEDDGDLTPEETSPYGECAPPRGPPPQPTCEDDLVGRADITFTLEQLLAALPRPGAERAYTRAVDNYEFSYRIVRLNDVVIPGTFERVN